MMVTELEVVAVAASVITLVLAAVLLVQLLCDRRRPWWAYALVVLLQVPTLLWTELLLTKVLAVMVVAMAGITALSRIRPLEER